MKTLTLALGKRHMAYRCVLLAQTIPPNVLSLLDEYQINASWIYDNKFFVGQGADANNKRLSDQGRLACIENLREDLLANKGVSGLSFQEQYCATMKAGEIWIAKQRRLYGGLCDQPFFLRCVKFLQTNRARTQIFTCLRAGRKFDNDAADAPGIEQCRAVVVELEKLKALPKEGHGLVAAGHGLDAGGAASPGHGIDAAGHGLDAAGHNLVAAVLEEEEPDPTKEAAVKKTDMALARLQYYSSLDEMKRCLPAIVHPSHAVMVIVEAPTSKLRVALEMLEQAKGVVEALTTKEVCIVIPSGSRVDLLSAVTAKVDLLWCVFLLNALHLSSRIVHLPAPSPENLRPWAASWPWAVAAAVLTSISPESHQCLRPLADCFEPGSRHSRPSAHCFTSHRGLWPIFFCLWPSVSGSKQDVVNLFAECSISAFGRLVRDVPSRPVGVSFGRLFLPRKIGLWQLGANHSFQV